jgi:hypothetical protein
MALFATNTARVSALILVSLLGLNACDSDSNIAATDDGTMPAPGTTPGEDITLEGLDGDWSSACIAATDAATFSTTTIAVADNIATGAASIYTDNACTTPATPASITTERSLEFDGNTSSTSLGDASHVTWIVESRTVDGADDTSGVNAMVWDIMLITNDTLYFGDRSGSNDGSEEALRPTALDEISIFTRN